jgi:hypothetical protein
MRLNPAPKLISVLAAAAAGTCGHQPGVAAAASNRARFLNFFRAECCRSLFRSNRRWHSAQRFFQAVPRKFSSAGAVLQAMHRGLFSVLMNRYAANFGCCCCRASSHAMPRMMSARTATERG